MKTRPYILSIAGFDPSAGAGLTADIKTIEALKGYGLGVCTANTVQTDVDCKACYWIDIQVIMDQISLLFERFTVDYVKIGIVQNWNILNDIIDVLHQLNPRVKIVLDPVLSASSDFDFHEKEASNVTLESTFDRILNKIYLLTPNYKEIERLYSAKNVQETIDYISAKTNLLLKGGHRPDNLGKDELYLTGGKRFVLNPRPGLYISEKHGSGCVLSSAIATWLAHGFPLLKSCFRGKRYTEKVLSSNKTLLGYHKI